jgi:hypothetical protein
MCLHDEQGDGMAQTAGAIAGGTLNFGRLEITIPENLPPLGQQARACRNR